MPMGVECYRLLLRDGVTRHWSVCLSVTFVYLLCCVLNIGKSITVNNLNINMQTLPVVSSVRDLGITVTSSFHGSPSVDVNDIVTRAHK